MSWYFLDKNCQIFSFPGPKSSNFGFLYRSYQNLTSLWLKIAKKHTLALAQIKIAKKYYPGADQKDERKVYPCGQHIPRYLYYGGEPPPPPSWATPLINNYWHLIFTVCMCCGWWIGCGIFLSTTLCLTLKAHRSLFWTFSFMLKGKESWALPRKARTKQNRHDTPSK